MRGRSSITTLVLAFLASVLWMPTMSSHAQSSDASLSKIGTYSLSMADSVAMESALATSPGPMRPKGAAPRILLLSSGVQADLFPAAAQLAISISTTDPIGYGTMAASQIFQFAPTAQIISGSIFPNGVYAPEYIRYGLEWANKNPDKVDAVLLAFPPALLIDPISGSMQNGTFDRIFDVLGANALPGPGGPLFGMPFAPMEQFDRFIQPLPYYERVAMQALRTSWEQWLWPRWEISKLKEKGISVVMPAGDTGPQPQSILGLANLPDVITVGGYDGSSVSSSSAVGPGMDGSVKPDLIASTGTMGLVPKDSLLAVELGKRNLLIDNPNPDWGLLGSPSQNAKGARIDSTMSAAASVATIVAGLRREGLTSSDAQRGALMAKAKPLPGVEAWRQGGGLLSEAPDRAFAETRPLAVGNANLGLEPKTGQWTTDVKFLNGLPQTASADATHGIWTTALARSRWSTLATGPTLAATPTSTGVKVSVTAKHGEAGAYCGYVTVTLPLQLTEEIPLCMYEPIPTAIARAFYVHEESAEDETFSLQPALPPAADLIDHPLHLLPIDPIDHDLFSNVTTSALCAGSSRSCGHANLGGVIPGYYKVKLHADYATPYKDGVMLDPSDGNPGYQSFKTLLLPPAPCSQAGTFQDGGKWSDAWSACTTQNVKLLAPGHDVVGPSKETASYTITPSDPSGGIAPPPPTPELTVNMGFLQKLVGTTVSGRYIDLIDECRDMRYLRLAGDGSFRPSDLSSQDQPVEQGLWRFGCDSGAIPALPGASLSPAIGRYDFRLPTPNYSARTGFDFKYDIQNSLIFVVVVIGGDVQWAVITPDGLKMLNSTDGTAWADPNTYTRVGMRTGTAHIDFRFLPRGVSEGSLYFAFVPSQGFGVSRATVADLSMHLRTWTNLNWPGTDFGRCAEACGHSFGFDPQITLDGPSTAPWSGQFRGNCIARPSGSTCEDWNVLVHVPHNNASPIGGHLADVLHGGASVFADLRSAGGGVYTPGRTGQQVFDGVEVLAYADWSWYVQPRLSIEKRHIRTNGRFFDLLNIPVDYLTTHRGTTQVCIGDGAATNPFLSPCSSAQHAPLPSPTGPPTLTAYYPLENL